MNTLFKIVKCTSIILFIFIQTGRSQSLSLNDLLITAKKTNWNEVDDVLQRKGWEFYDSKKGDDAHYTTIVWAHDKQSYNDAARGWFHLYTYQGAPSKVSYLFFSKQTYNTIKASITTAGMKLSNSSVDDNVLTSTYSNASFIVNIQTAKTSKEDSYSETSQTTYTIEVINKSGEYDPDNGLKKTYDDDGKIDSEYNVKGGLLEGTFKTFHKNGKVRQVTLFVKDKRQGVSKEYNEDGTLLNEFTYVNDVVSGPYKQYKDGKLKESGSMLNGVRSGLVKSFNTDGKVDIEVNFKDDQRDGAYKEFYYEDGNVKYTVIGQYLNNKKNGYWQTSIIQGSKTNVRNFTNWNSGSKDGPFKEVASDSIIFGTYKNEMLNGDYLVFRSLKTLLTGEIDGDTVNTSLVTRGKYLNGSRTGYWKIFYLTRTLEAEGGYLNNLKDGLWKYYTDKYTDVDDEILPYSNQLILTENYDRGKQQGKSVRYGFLEKLIVKCNPADITEPLDTCYALKFSRVLETTNYSQDKFHGLYEYKDSTGRVYAKGNFVSNEKSGDWIEFSQPDPGEKIISQSRGKYVDGKRVGIWEYYFDNNQVYEVTNFQNGLRHGKSTLYRMADKPKEEQFFDRGYLKKVNEYDSTSNAIYRTYDLVLETAKGFSCRKTTLGKFKIVQDYYIPKDSPDPIAVDDFGLFFTLTVDILEEGYPEGDYQVYDEKGIIAEGTYLNKQKSGLWKFYYRDRGVHSEQQFSKNTGGITKYFTIGTGRPYSGKFSITDLLSEQRTEFKISKGLPQGTAKVFDKNGKLMKTMEFNEGVLTN